MPGRLAKRTTKREPERDACRDAHRSAGLCEHLCGTHSYPGSGAVDLAGGLPGSVPGRCVDAAWTASGKGTGTLGGAG